MDAFEAMKPFMLDCYANASQPYSFSRKAKKALKDARKTIADCINCEPEEIIFTSGGTESDNWAIKNFALYEQSPHIITSSIEHHAVLNSCESVRDYSDIKILSVDKYGFVSPNELESVLSTLNKCTMVSIMLANNEIGTIQPIKKLAEIAHSYGAVFHTDAVQAVGHISVDVKELDVDMLSASAHKFNGPKGIGFLYCKKGTQIRPFHNGGSQEFGLRAGTENIPAIVGMAVALKNNIKRIEENKAYCLKLGSVLLEKLRNSHVDFVLNGHETTRLPGNVNISLKEKSGEALMHLLDLKGIMVSTGSACDSVNQQVSHVIKSIHVPPEYAKGTLRISFSKDNTTEDAEIIASTLVNFVSK